MSKERKRKVRQVTETTVLDTSTGEMTKHESSTVRFMDSEPPYVKLYIEDISKLYDIPSAGKDLIYALLQRMDYQGYISLSKAYKELICKEIGVQDKTIRNTLTNLIKKGVIKNIGKGLYEMNPDLFARGTWSDIQKRREKFRLIIDYTIAGERKVSGDAID